MASSGTENTKQGQPSYPEGSVVLTPEDQAELQKYLDETQAVQTKDDAGRPLPASKDSIFRFFREILRMDDSSKTGNVSDYELGQLRLPIRGYQSIGHYCRLRGLDKIAEWSNGKAEITLATSLSKKGFLPQLFVTQIKKEQRVMGSKVIEKGFFGKKKVVEDGTNDEES